jgi:SAM-dependent methyltransferase
MWWEIYKKAAAVYHESGITGVLRAIWLVLRGATPVGQDSRDFDVKFDVDTEGVISLRSLGVKHGDLAHCVRYQATPPSVFAKLMEELPSDLHRYTFVDVGSGKGRIVLMAAQLPFRRVIGVELSAQLNEIAQRNLQRLPAGLRKCGDLQLICSDASDYEIPDEPTIVFLYNPFVGPLAEKFFQGVAKSLRARPRDVRIIYRNPAARILLDRLDLFEVTSASADHVSYRSRGCLN